MPETSPATPTPDQTQPDAPLTPPMPASTEVPTPQVQTNDGNTAKPINKKLVLVLVFVSLFVLLTTGGFLGYKYLTTSNQSETTTAPTPTAPAETTTNWQVYDNGNFSLKYPTGWTYRVPVAGDTVLFYIDGPVLGTESRFYIFVETTDKLPAFTLTPTTISGSVAYVTSDRPSGPGGAVSYYLQSPDNSYLVVSYSPANVAAYPTLAAHKEIFDQILSTLKFSNSGVETSTVTSSQNKFQLTYPIAYKITSAAPGTSKSIFFHPQESLDPNVGVNITAIPADGNLSEVCDDYFAAYEDIQCNSGAKFESQTINGLGWEIYPVDEVVTGTTGYVYAATHNSNRLYVISSYGVTPDEVQKFVDGFTTTN